MAIKSGQIFGTLHVNVDGTSDGSEQLLLRALFRFLKFQFDSSAMTTRMNYARVFRWIEEQFFRL